MAQHSNPCPATRRHGPHGFTLLELLVVLSVLGLMMALVGPNLVNRLDKSAERFALDMIRAQLEQMPRWARVFSQPLVLEQVSGTLLVQNEEILNLEDGWEIRFEPALQISTNQICSAAHAVVLVNEQELAHYAISAPDCSVVEVEP